MKQYIEITQLCDNDNKENKDFSNKYNKAHIDCHDLLCKSRNDDIFSTAMLHPILEDNEIKYPHK